MFVAATGLHLLVNWAGELSLAHAAMVGAPAFLVATLSADHDVSTVWLLPVGIIGGAVLGAIIGLPALRARGLQVALVTLVAGVAIERWLFTKEWFSGPTDGARVGAPDLGFITLETSRSEWPLLVAVAGLAVLAAWVLFHSKVTRSLQWIAAEPRAAAAFGIPVHRYRTLAFALAGAFAGLAGALTTLWVQRLTPDRVPGDPVADLPHHRRPRAAAGSSGVSRSRPRSWRVDGCSSPERTRSSRTARRSG